MKITDEKPCSHMEALLDREAEGTAPWWIRWYVLAHVARCGPCKRVLLSLRAILREMKGAKKPEMPAGTAERLESGSWRSALADE